MNERQKKDSIFLLISFTIRKYKSHQNGISLLFRLALKVALCFLNFFFHILLEFIEERAQLIRPQVFQFLIFSLLSNGLGSIEYGDTYLRSSSHQIRIAERFNKFLIISQFATSEVSYKCPEHD